jgi:hypothetical protein
VARALTVGSLSPLMREISIERFRSSLMVSMAPGRSSSCRPTTATSSPLRVTQRVVRALEMILLTDGRSCTPSQNGFPARMVFWFQIPSMPFPGIAVMFST